MPKLKKHAYTVDQYQRAFKKANEWIDNWFNHPETRRRYE